jgi:hypothetical protein
MQADCPIGVEDVTPIRLWLERFLRYENRIAQPIVHEGPQQFALEPCDRYAALPRSNCSLLRCLLMQVLTIDSYVSCASSVRLFSLARIHHALTSMFLEANGVPVKR